MNSCLDSGESRQQSVGLTVALLAVGWFGTSERRFREATRAEEDQGEEAEAPDPEPPDADHHAAEQRCRWTRWWRVQLERLLKEHHTSLSHRLHSAFARVEAIAFG